MPIFQQPPPMPAGRTAVTPPEPHVPIGTQGNQPPRYTTALMLAVVLSSWPADLEPRLQKPNNQQQKIAPLTLTYGQAPAPQAFLTNTELRQIVASWQPEPLPPPNPEPTAAWNVPLSARIAWTPPPRPIWDAWQPAFVKPPAPVAVAPLTLAYGTQPRPQFALSVSRLLRAVDAWTQTWDAQTAPKSAGWNVPPVLVVLPHVPPQGAIRTAWEPLWRTPQRLVSIAPLAFGQAPPQRPPLTVAIRQVIEAWPRQWPTVPRLLYQAVIGTPPTVSAASHQAVVGTYEMRVALTGTYVHAEALTGTTSTTGGFNADTISITGTF